MEFSKLENILAETTSNWANEQGEVSLESQFELKAAKEILEKYYKNVSYTGPDDDTDEDGSSYLVKYSELKFEPDLNPENFIGNASQAMTESKTLHEDSEELLKFKEYCKDKIKTLREVSYTTGESDEVIKVKPMLVQDIGNDKNVKVWWDEEDEILYGVAKRKLVMQTNMTDIFGFMGQLQFKSIDKHFYEDVIKHWDDVYMDETITLDESIEKHQELNPVIFEDNHMKSEVREKLLEISNKFLDELSNDKIELKPVDIVLLGSNASYNYSSVSDLDIHIIADTSIYDNEFLVQKLYDARRHMFNSKYEISINGYEVELYVESNEVGANSNGIYSIMNDKWVKEPDLNSIPEVDNDKVNSNVEPYEKEYNELVHKEDLTIEEIDKMIDKMYMLRISSILTDGEYSEGNLIFKEFRNRGYLQSLKDLKTDLESQSMSIFTEAYIPSSSKKEALEEYLDSQVTYDSDRDVYNTLTGESYKVFTEEEEAAEAEENLRTLLSDRYFEDIFSKEFLEVIIDECLPEQEMQEIIKSFIQEEDKSGEGFDYARSVLGNYHDEVNFMKELYGDEGFKDWAYENADIDLVVNEALDTADYSEFIPSLDGDVIELGSGYKGYLVENTEE